MTFLRLAFFMFLVIAGTTQANASKSPDDAHLVFGGEFAQLASGTNLREGNSRNTKVLRKAKPDEVFLVLPRYLENNYAQLLDKNGDTYYVYYPLVKHAFSSYRTKEKTAK